jgi:hypothetical protein
MRSNIIIAVPGEERPLGKPFLAAVRAFPTVWVISFEKVEPASLTKMSASLVFLILYKIYWTKIGSPRRSLRTLLARCWDVSDRIAPKPLELRLQ